MGILECVIENETYEVLEAISIEWNLDIGQAIDRLVMIKLLMDWKENEGDTTQGLPADGS